MVLTRLSFSIILLILSTVSLAQDVGVRLDRLDSEIQKKLSELEDLRSQVEDIKLAELILDLEHQPIISKTVWFLGSGNDEVIKKGNTDKGQRQK